MQNTPWYLHTRPLEPAVLAVHRLRKLRLLAAQHEPQHRAHSIYRTHTINTTYLLLQYFDGPPHRLGNLLDLLDQFAHHPFTRVPYLLTPSEAAAILRAAQPTLPLRTAPYRPTIRHNCPLCHQPFMAQPGTHYFLPNRDHPICPTCAAACPLPCRAAAARSA